MIYVWNENGLIFGTERLEDVPSQFQDTVKVFEDLTVNDFNRLYIDETGDIKVRPITQTLGQLKNILRTQLKQKVYTILSQTDWVIIKCIELNLNPNDAYPQIMSRRANIRQINEQLETAIENATTIEELNQITQEINNLQ